MSAVSYLEQIDRQSKFTQSGIDRLSTSSKGLSGAFQAAKKQSETLSNQLRTAQQKVELYQKGIDGLNTIIKRSKTEQESLAKQIDKVSGELKESEERLKAVRKEHGKESEEYQKAQKEASKYNESLLSLQSRYDYLSDEIKNSENKITEFQTSVNKTETEIKGLNSQLAQSRSKLAVFGSYAQEAGAKWEATGKKISNVGNALTKGVTLPVAALGVGAFKAAADFETAFTGVTKTVDGTSQQMDTLRQGIIDMATDTQNAVPSTTTEIAAVAEAAGQLGIQTDNILKFSRTMIDLGNSTNLAAEEGASELAKFANITQMSQRDFDRLGSTIVDLGNKFATTEADIVAMGMRLAGAGAQIGLSQSEIMGFATALSSVGIEAEMGGSAFSKAMVKMQVACETGLEPVQKLSARTGLSLRELQLMSENASKDFTDLASSLGMTKSELQNTIDAGLSLENFADVAGVTAEQFKKAFEQDATQAIQLFINGLGDTETKGESTIQMLQEMGFSETRLRDTMTRLANSGDLVTRAVDTGNKAWEENVALTNEANKRYQTTDSKLKIARNTIVDAGRSIGEQLLPVVADLAQDLSGLVKSFSNLPKGTQKAVLGFAAVSAAAGPAIKVFGGVTTGIGKLNTGAGKLIKILGEKSAARTAAKGIEGVGSAAAKSTTSLGGMTGLLTKLASPAGVAIGATAAIVGIGVAIYKVRDNMLKANIKEHFGNITLSAEEMEDVVKRLTTNGWTIRIDAAMEASKKVQDLKQEIETTIEELNKTEWKIGIGLDLTDEEKQGYRSNLSSYVDQTIQYIEQQHYASTLAIDVVFKPGSVENANAKRFSKDFYNGLNTELTALGTELSDLVNKAFEDGLLDSAEMALIESKRAEIQKKLAEISQANYDLKLDKIRADATKGGLSKDSFDDLQKQLNEALDERKQEIEQEKQEYLLPYQVKLNSGGISKEEFDKIKIEAQTQADISLSELMVDNVNIEIGTIKSNYQQELENVLPEYQDSIRRFVDSAGTVTEQQLAGMLNSVGTVFRYTGPKLNKESQKVISDMLKQMQPKKEQLTKTAQECVNAGKTIPDSVLKGISEIAELEAATNNVDGIFTLIGEQIANSPEKLAAVKQAQAAGHEIPQELIDAISLYSGEVYDASTGMWNKVSESSIQNIYGVKKTLSACGIDASEALIQSIRSKGPDVWDETVSLLNQLNQAEAEQRPGILAQLMDLGIAVDNSLGQGMYDNIEFIKNAASGSIDVINTATGERITQVTPEFVAHLRAMGVTGVKGMEEAVSGAIILPPDVNEFPDEHVRDWARNRKIQLEEALKKQKIGVALATGDWSQGRGNGWDFKADGGIVNEPVIAGEAGPESIIPLSAAKRSRALELYAETGRLLGAESAFADFTVRGQWSAGGASLGAGDSLDRLLDKKIDQLSDKLLRVLMATAPQVNITSPEPMSAAQVAAEFRRNQIRAAIRL